MSDLVMLGAGAHARVLLSALRLTGHRVVGCIAADGPDGNWPKEIAYLGPDSALRSLDPGPIALVSGIGGVGSNARRRLIFERAKAAGFAFHSVVHPHALVADDVEIGEGAVIMMGAILQAGCIVGPNAIVNTGAIVDHHGRIGAHAHIAPGASLSGNVRIGDGAHVGTGASVIQGVSIGEDAVLGAGSVVIADIPARGCFAGVPARSIGDSGRAIADSDRECF